MDKLQQRNTNNSLTCYRRRFKKRRSRLFITYALQAIIVLLCFLVLVLIICGCLYIREHLTSDPSADGNQYDVLNSFDELEGNETGKDQAVVPTIPSAPTAIVVLDPGHGGIQSGCEFDGVLEKDITLSIVLLLQEKLESKGVTVILTRDADEDVSLSRRSEIANSAGANYFVSIHCNSYEDDSSVKGFECYYYQSGESKDMAEAITLSADNHLISTRKTKEENYAVLRNTAIPAVLIEVGFMTNAQERIQLMSLEYQELLAESIASGLLNYDNTL